MFELNKDELNREIKRLYVEEKYSMRKIGRILKRDHHYIKRRLEEEGIEITQRGRIRDPFSDETKRKMSEKAKQRGANNQGVKMSIKAVYKNMRAHLKYDIELDWLMQFKNIEKLKCLNKILSRDRVCIHFNSEKYKMFIEKFYYDTNFNKQFEIYCVTRDKWDLPSLDHVLPLSKGGTWDLDNLQIISWFENRAKCDLQMKKFEELIRKYFFKYFEGASYDRN